MHLNELILYRMPDSTTGGIQLVAWVLSLNGIAIEQATEAHPLTAVSPEPEFPAALCVLARKLERATGAQCSYRDRRVRPATTINIGGIGVRLVAPTPRTI
jgi:hypothetical protein